MIDADLGVLLPEILLSVFAMLALIGAVYGGKNRLAEPLLLVTAMVFILIAVLVAGLHRALRPLSLRPLPMMDSRGLQRSLF